VPSDRHNGHQGPSIGNALPRQPAIEANPPTIARYATWARTVAIGVPRRSCAPRILGLERPPAVGALSALRLDQAQANQREDPSLRDQQVQVGDCLQPCAALGDDDLIAAVCADLCLSSKRPHTPRSAIPA
jgi:hypothetical protein